MALVEAGDTIFHYTAQYVVGVGAATGRGRQTPKPYVDRSDEDRVEEGLQIPLVYRRLDEPIAKKDMPLDVRLAAMAPADPFDKNGDFSQGYLVHVGAELHETLQQLAGIEPQSIERLVEEELAVEGPADVERVTYGRAEQRALRKWLLQGCDQAECGLWGQPTAAKYLVAAHIKPRRDCTEQERRDPNVAMLACLMGCDAAFENGDLRVFGNGAMSVALRNFDRRGRIGPRASRERELLSTVIRTRSTSRIADSAKAACSVWLPQNRLPPSLPSFEREPLRP